MLAHRLLFSPFLLLFQLGLLRASVLGLGSTCLSEPQRAPRKKPEASRS